MIVCIISSILKRNMNRFFNERRYCLNQEKTNNDYMMTCIWVLNHYHSIVFLAKPS